MCTSRNHQHHLSLQLLQGGRRAIQKEGGINEVLANFTESLAAGLVVEVSSNVVWAEILLSDSATLADVWTAISKSLEQVPEAAITMMLKMTTEIAYGLKCAAVSG